MTTAVLRKISIAVFPALVLLLSLQSAAAQKRPADLPTVLAQKLSTAKKSILPADSLVMKTGASYERADSSTGIALSEICDLSDPVANRVFREYGAMFIGENDVFAGFPAVYKANGLRPIVNCVFEDNTSTDLYQRTLRETVKTKTVTIGRTTIELQERAMDALLRAVDEARAKNLAITPRGGALSARRSYDDTKRLWDSRFYPALAYWVAKGRLTPQQAEEARRLDIKRQVQQVLAWEAEGIYFSKDFSKSILYSVAAPGASQHIFMLALDVEQFANREVREILARHGWFQTVYSDLPHFTYLGLDESRLPDFGLEAKFSGGHKFWVPRID